MLFLPLKNCDFAQEWVMTHSFYLGYAEVAMEQREFIGRMWGLVEPELAEQGYELVELEMGQQGHTPVLRVFIDKEGGGITLDDCTEVTQLLDPVLDRADVMDNRYMLEVSSPGFDRPLRKAADFDRFKGESVKLRSLAPVEGRSRFKGVLTGFDDGLIQLDCDGQPWNIHIENLKSARLDR